MTTATKFGLIGLGLAALFACSKPVSLVVGEKGVGPVTAETTFAVDVVAGLLPDTKVSAVVSDNLQPGEHVIRISDGDHPLFELYPSPDGKTVESALILDASIKDAKGVHIGSTFAEVIPNGDTSECGMGQGPKVGRLYCPQAGSTHIFYELQSSLPPKGDAVPDANELKTWTVTAMLWDGSESAP
jgi:hypothetical protein